MTDVFISYSRKDKMFVQQVHAALAKLERDVWVDWEDIPLTADWWKEICAGIEAADTFVFVITPESARSKVCFDEIDHAAKQNKRITPILHEELLEEADKQRLHPIVNRHNWIFLREGEDFEGSFKKLIQAIDTDLQHVRTHTRLLVRAIEWERRGRDLSFLLRGSDLNDAEAWLAASGGKDPKPTELQTEFILASRQAENRRQRTLLAGVSIALAVALGLAALSFLLFSQSEERRVLADNNAATAVYQGGVAQSNALAAQSQLDLRGPISERAVLLGLEALENYPYTRQAENALILAVQSSRARLIFTSQTAYVSSGDWSRNGLLIATGDVEGTVKVWEADTARELLSMDGGDNPIRVVAWSPDATRLLTVDSGGSTKVWDAETGEEILSLSDSYEPVAWSPDGTQIVTNIGSGTALFQDAESGEAGLALVTGEDQGLRGLAFSPDGSQIITTYDGGTVNIWDATSGEQLDSIITGAGQINDVAWSPDGYLFATADSAEATASLWDAVFGSKVLSFIRHQDNVDSVAWSPDGRFIASAGYSPSELDLNAHVWDTLTGTELLVLSYPSGDVANPVWSPDGTRLLTVGSRVEIWDVRNLGGQNSSQMMVEARAQHWIEPLVWSPDGKSMTISGSSFDRVTGEKLVDGSVTYIMGWSPDGQRVIVGTRSEDDRTIALVLEAESNNRLFSLDGQVNDLLAVYWSPDGTRILTAEGSHLGNDTRGGAAILWDGDTGQELLRLEQNEASFDDAEWSPDSQRVVSLSRRLLFEDNAFTGFISTVKVWDAETGAELLTFSQEVEDAFDVAWSPDGSRILTGHYGGMVRLWDAATGELRLSISGQANSVDSVAWSPNGARFVTSGNDGTARIWDAATGLEIASLAGHTLSLNRVAWSPDGTQIVTTSSDGTAQIWRVWQTTEDLVAYAKECCVARALTAEERAQYGLPPE